MLQTPKRMADAHFHMHSDAEPVRYVLGEDAANKGLQVGAHLEVDMRFLASIICIQNGIS